MASKKIPAAAVRLYWTGENDILIAEWNGSQVAKAMVTRSGNRLEINDIRVEKKYVPATSFFKSILVSIGFPRAAVDLRGRGVGRLLMEKLLADADQSGTMEVWGWISKYDLEEWPDLEQWYRNRGFNVGPPDSECDPRVAVAKIQRFKPQATSN